MKDQTRVIAALLIGAAAGAALGLLLAPEKGETIRDGIADYINDLVDAAKDKAQAASKDIKQYSGSVYDKAKTKLSSTVNDLNDYGDAAIKAAHTKADDLKEQAQSKFNEDKARIKNGSDEVNNSIQNS
jgi:gas vesicle protein